MPLETILGLREAYRTEMHCQIVHDSWHARGFTTSYLLQLDGQTAGYGSVGGAPGEPREILKEFYLHPALRGDALAIFRRLLAVGGARVIQAQTNDALLTLMLFDCATDLVSDTILFADAIVTTRSAPGVRFRPITDVDRVGMFPHGGEPVGDWVLEHGSEIVATGGLLFHYNPPYGDLFMEVAPSFRGRGYGSYLVQELKRVCYEAGKVPAARCQASNVASRRALERAGLFPCGRIVRAEVADPAVNMEPPDRGALGGEA